MSFGNCVIIGRGSAVFAYPLAHKVNCLSRYYQFGETLLRVKKRRARVGGGGRGGERGAGNGWRRGQGRGRELVALLLRNEGVQAC